MKVICLDLRYVPGDYSLVQGIKGGGTPGRTVSRNGKRVVEEGFGYGRSITSSKLELYAKTDDSSLKIRVDGFFKANVGRLTEKRRDKLRSAMPKEITVHKEMDGRYSADEKELRAWQKDAGL